MNPMASPIRQCPRDWRHLERRRRSTIGRSVEVDECPKCNGLFLDKGEIKALTGQADLHKLLTRYLGLDSDSQIVCPGCGGLMDAEDAGDLVVDVCINCYGVWVDAGELERLRSMDSSKFLDFTPEKVAEILKAGDIRRDERRGLFRSYFGGLGRRRR